MKQLILVLLFSGLVACQPASTEPPKDAGPTTLTFNAFDALDYVLEAVDGEAATGEEGAKDPPLTLSIGKRYRIVNKVTSSHPVDLIAQGASPAEDTILLSQRNASSDSFIADSEVNFVEEENGFSFTLTEKLAAELDGYRCNFHPVNMRGDISQ